MRIAILGATSQIAKDLILSIAVRNHHELALYARRPKAVREWLQSASLAERYSTAGFDAFSVNERFDAILNFVGVGNPAQTAALGAAIFDITAQYDEMALGYLQKHPGCRYIFLSSGAAYGANFDAPADENTRASVAINHLQPQDWYGVAKLYAECRHRALPELPIVDIRVFNYFSHTQDMSARFLITDMLRAIREKTVMKTSPDYIVRDFVHPSDFHGLVEALLSAAPANAAVDCYSRAPIDKPTLLESMQREFGLRYEVIGATAAVNATGAKPHYYSRNRRAADFGYAPTLTSWDGLLIESTKALELS